MYKHYNFIIFIRSYKGFYGKKLTIILIYPVYCTTDHSKNLCQLFCFKSVIISLGGCLFLFRNCRLWTELPYKRINQSDILLNVWPLSNGSTNFDNLRSIKEFVLPASSLEFIKSRIHFPCYFQSSKFCTNVSIHRKFENTVRFIEYSALIFATMINMN